MRFLVGFFIGGIGGFIGGLLAMLIIFPFLFPPPMVNEIVSGGGTTLLETSFRENVSGQDLAHWGRGDIKVYEGENGNVLVEFQTNFEVGAGPNFWLYVNKFEDINNETDFNNDTSRVRLTKIKSFQGSQVYEIAADDFKNAKALTIWCDSFGQYIASANL